MTDLWTGGRVRLRGVEPQDREGFRALALHTVDARNADVVEPPRSDESFAPGPPSAPSEVDLYRKAFRRLSDAAVHGDGAKEVLGRSRSFWGDARRA